MRRAHSPPSHLTGDDLCALSRAFALALEQNEDVINALNVFPVPDCDTGRNMVLTLRAVLEETSKRSGEPAGAIAEAMAHRAVLGARGNSGVILSQFFRGLARGLAQAEKVDGHNLARALREAATASYKAVGNPVEGTMLTVIREAADAAERAAQRTGADVESVWDAATRAATEAVQRTPSLLPVLREAGVVDAGGQGLAVMLEAGLRHLRGESLADLRLEGVAPDSVPVVSEEFLEATEADLYGYCIQFLVQGEFLDVDTARQQVNAIAQSAVVVGDDTLVKVHVHALDPGPALSFGASQGTLAQVRVENIDEQHQEFMAVQRGSAPRAGSAAATGPTLAVVAVVPGQGLAEVFKNIGASLVVSGGQTMNPSTQDLLDAVERAPSRVVAILPNNKNIVPVARQVTQFARNRDVRVIPSRTIPQGIAALLACNLDRSLEENLASMQEALASVKTLEVTRAVRSTVADGIRVRAGQAIAILDGNLVAAEDDLPDVVLKVLRRAMDPYSELITLYWGQDTTAEDSGALAHLIREEFHGMDVEIVHGGQPHYPYLISVE